MREAREALATAVALGMSEPQAADLQERLS
jgi:hypothetical protein